MFFEGAFWILFIQYIWILFKQMWFFSGYRRRRISFCLIGLTSISIFTYMVIITEANFSTVINILISVAAGLVACFFTTLLLYCGYFITGLFAGFMIGFIFLVIYTSFTSLNSVALPCVIVSLFGLFQTFITMWWRHRVFIVSCCIFASGVMASALDYFIEDLFIYKYLEMKIFYNKHADLCWWTYLVFGLWPLFFIIGLLIQFLLTGKEKQKETYTFIYRRHKRSSSRVHDDNNYLIRHDYHNY